MERNYFFRDQQSNQIHIRKGWISHCFFFRINIRLKLLLSKGEPYVLIKSHPVVIISTKKADTCYLLKIFKPLNH